MGKNIVRREVTLLLTLFQPEQAPRQRLVHGIWFPIEGFLPLLKRVICALGDKKLILKAVSGKKAIWSSPEEYEMAGWVLRILESFGEYKLSNDDFYFYVDQIIFH